MLCYKFHSRPYQGMGMRHVSHVTAVPCAQLIASFPGPRPASRLQLIHLSSISIETLRVSPLPSLQPVHVRHRSPPRHMRRRKQGANGASSDPDLQEGVQKTTVKEEKDSKVCEP